MIGAAALRDDVLGAGRGAGLTVVGVCGAEPFDDVRSVLESRRAEGLNADMAFTYRNPARSTDPGATMHGARSMVVGALRYDADPAQRPSPTSARVARYATQDHYARLRGALGEMADVLRAAGHRAMVLADDNAMVDRAVAVRAGLGWSGKNSNVLVPGHGSWVVLGSVLTDADLESTGAPIDDGCGGCRRCLDGCPTGAIVAPGVVDARRCLAWLVQSAEEFPREHRVALGDRIYGCDDCQEVCPPSRRSDVVHAPTGAEQAAGGDPGAWVSVEWLLTASDDELFGHVGRWYVPRRDARYLRRNALLVAGNTARPDDAAILAAIEALLDGDDDMLAGYAAWAALRLGRADLIAGRRAARATVAVELASPPPVRALPDGSDRGGSDRIAPWAPDVLAEGRPEDDGAR